MFSKIHIVRIHIAMKFLRGVGHFRCFSESFISRTQSVINSVENVLWSCIFEEGKYMVIYVNPETSTFDELGFNLWDIGKSII